MTSSMPVKLMFAAAFGVAVLVALLLPVPHKAKVEAKSTIPQVSIGH
ncbi:MAG: hypothetical protein JWM33_2798 [Caulobacteraceae bacterium]|nr:hypothetical protein [Caulobacteraceae bacterium]